MDTKKITELIITFIRQIGIEVYFENIDRQTFLPGMMIRNGSIIIDAEKLLYPGDLLHEAGHIAVSPGALRGKLDDERGEIEFDGGNEMAAMAWSYAACRYLDIDPRIVFHDDGYKGAGESIANNFNQGMYMGTPLLQLYGMTYINAKQYKGGADTYPHMVSWLSKR